MNIPVESSASTAAAAADGASPMASQPRSVHTCASTFIAVVLPDPAGARASCTRRSLLAMAVTRSRWPRLSGRRRPRRRRSVISTSSGSNEKAPFIPPAADEALLGFEDADGW